MILFSLRARTDKYLGTAYCKRGTAYIYLDNLLLNNRHRLSGRVKFRSFIREFWVTYFHEYLHLFFTNELGKWGHSCATKIDPLAQRLMWSMMENEEFDKFTVDLTRTLRVREKPDSIIVEIDGWDYFFDKKDRYKELPHYGDTLAFSHKGRTSGT